MFLQALSDKNTTATLSGGKGQLSTDPAACSNISGVFGRIVIKTDYYVYAHKDSEGIVFYIGKGKGSRFKDKVKRTRAWLAKAANGFSHEIIVDGLTNKEALQKEYDLITNPSPNWSLVNIHTPLVDNLNLDEALKWFKYSPHSPSGIVWKDTLPETPSYCKSKIVPGGMVGFHTKEGYWRIRVPCCKMVAAHRLVYAIHNGTENLEGMVINHIDNDNGNNNIDNLELVTQEVNNRRRKNNAGSLRLGNNSGVNGVYKEVSKKDGSSRYRAMWMTIDGVYKTKSFSTIKLGESQAFLLACEHRKAMIAELNLQGAGYTERHGT